jgi:hypothetical protein
MEIACCLSSWFSLLVLEAVNELVAILFSAVFSLKKHYAEKRFSVTSNLRYMYGVLNVDEIKN